MNFQLQPSAPFPCNALPSPLYELAQEIQWKTQAPIELIVSSILGAVSLACQNSIDVRVPGVNSVSPVSLCLIVIAKSGERKSTVDKLVMQSIRDFEAKQAELMNAELDQFEADWMAWDIKRKEIKKAIAKAYKITAPSGQSRGGRDE